MIVRTLAAIFIASVASSALAQDDLQNIDHIATVVAGVRAEASVRLGPVENGYVNRISPGAFDVSAEGGSVAHMTIAESSPCVFDVTFAVGDAAPVGTVRFDFNQLTAVAVEERENQYSLNGIHIALEGPDDAIQNIYPDGRMENSSDSTTMYTSLNPADVEAAANLLLEACPAG